MARFQALDVETQNRIIALAAEHRITFALPLRHAPRIVQRVWEAAERVRSTAFIDKKSGGVSDDHTPFLEKGLPVILLIDIDYPPYHTTQDLPNKCSPESLGQVGRVVMEAINTPY